MRLSAVHASAVVDCFNRAYGGTYANASFADASLLAERMRTGGIRSVGALLGSTVIAHMAMSAGGSRQTAELGNTVVDPAARGSGLAWQVGRELTQWCRELGFKGFLHYPTTDHHIMQRQSVKEGFETGLMLGYIPAETHGRVNKQRNTLRQSVTVVYQPLATAPAANCYTAEPFTELIAELAQPTHLQRHWLAPAHSRSAPTLLETVDSARRGLRRITIRRGGSDLQGQLKTALADGWPCLQIDLHMDDAALQSSVDTCLSLGAMFCAWLPAFADSDVLRLQCVDGADTNLQPAVVNPVAQRILAELPEPVQPVERPR